MITSVADICKEKGLKLEATIYRHSCQQMFGFEIVSGNLFLQKRRV